MQHDGPECPEQFIYLWNFFCEISAGASGGGGFGPVTIAWIDMRAWADLTGETIEPWEARLILRVSSLQASIASENAGKGRSSR